MDDLEQQLDRLYGLSLDQFTPARNELARQLKEARESDSAAAVRALAKPTQASWAVNQLSRREQAGVRRLLDAGESLRKAQQQLLRKGGATDPVRDAQADVRDQVRALTERARALLEETGRPVTQATLERVGRTLQAAAVEDEGRHGLEAGRLTSDLQPPGFEAFTSLGGTAAPTKRRAGDELAERRRLREEEQRRKKDLQQRVRDLERAARDAEREAQRAETAATKARNEAQRVRAAADEAAAELAELR